MHKFNQSPLKTMRGELPDFYHLPKDMRSCLVAFDQARKTKGIDPCPSINSEWRGIQRLNRGLKRLTVNGVRTLARNCGAKIDRKYIQDHQGDLLTLQGLFYWTGEGKLIRSILLRAWIKGKDLDKPGAQNG